MGKCQTFFSLFFILAMTNLQRIFSLSVNLIICITYHTKRQKSRKTFNYFIARCYYRPSPFFKIVLSLFYNKTVGGAFFQYGIDIHSFETYARVKKIRDLFDFGVYLLMLIQCHARKKDGAT